MKVCIAQLPFKKSAYIGRLKNRVKRNTINTDFILNKNKKLFTKIKLYVNISL